MSEQESRRPEHELIVEGDLRAATAGIVVIAAILGVVAFHYLGPVLRPLFIAALLYYLVSPGAEMLIARGMRRWLAYLVAMIVLAAIMTGFGFVVYANAQAVQRRLPYYEGTISQWTQMLATKSRVVGGQNQSPLFQKPTDPPEPNSENASEVKDPTSETPVEKTGNDAPPSDVPESAAPEEKAAAKLENSNSERPDLAEKEAEKPAPALPDPLPPQKNGPIGDLFDVSAEDLLSWGFGTALGFIGNMVAVLFYLAFIVLEAHKFPERLRRAFSDERAEEFMDFGKKVTESVRQYLVIKTLISLGTGAAAAVIMLLFGLEFWPLWAVLTFLFNYVPYIGSLAATVFPIVIGLVQFGNPWLAGLMAVLLGINQQIWGNLVEPQVMGKHLNISPLALLIFVAYWGWLWGIVGMVLSVPLAVLIKMLLAFFPRTRRVAILISAD